MKAYRGMCHVPGCTSPILHGILCKPHYHRLWHEKRRNGKEEVSLEELAKMEIIPKPRPPGGKGGTATGPFQKLTLSSDKIAGLATQLPIGRIVTQDEIDAMAGLTSTQLQERLQGTLGPGVHEGTLYPPAKKPTPKQSASRRQQLHEGIASTLSILNLFYTELRELDSK